MIYSIYPVICLFEAVYYGGRTISMDVYCVFYNGK